MLLLAQVLAGGIGRGGGMGERRLEANHLYKIRDKKALNPAQPTPPLSITGPPTTPPSINWSSSALTVRASPASLLPAKHRHRGGARLRPGGPESLGRAGRRLARQGGQQLAVAG